MSETEQAIQEFTYALWKLYSRINTLSSIDAENILFPSGPQARYHEILEEAYAALSKVETEVDALRSELESQHKHLDEARDVALERKTKERHHESG